MGSWWVGSHVIWCLSQVCERSNSPQRYPVQPVDRTTGGSKLQCKSSVLVGFPNVQPAEGLLGSVAFWHFSIHDYAQSWVHAHFRYKVSRVFLWVSQMYNLQRVCWVQWRFDTSTIKIMHSFECMPTSDPESPIQRTPASWESWWGGQRYGIRTKTGLQKLLTPQQWDSTIPAWLWHGFLVSYLPFAKPGLICLAVGKLIWCEWFSLLFSFPSTFFFAQNMHPFVPPYATLPYMCPSGWRLQIHCTFPIEMEFLEQACDSARVVPTSHVMWWPNSFLHQSIHVCTNGGKHFEEE